VFSGETPLALAELIVNGAHTSPVMTGRVFQKAGARMSVMRHLAVDHQTVGPVVISQDLTVFHLRADALITD
jgi:ribonuclease Z